jgi:signal transduction histidine kinase
MEVQLEHPAEEIRRLRRCINDLVSVIALPAMWSGSERSQIVRTLLDVLLEMLHLDLVYVRLENPAGEAPVEIARVAQPRSLRAGPQEVGELLHRCLGGDPQNWPSSVRNRIGDEDISIVPLRLGLQGEIGFIVAGSQRLDFPGQTERLLLSVAANQATIGLQEARLLSEQKRITKELDQRVAQRTSELAAANEELKKEVAERRRAEAFLAEGQHLARLGNFSWRVATDEIAWSEQLYRIFEFGQGMPVTLELIGSRVHPEDIPMLNDMINGARSGVSDFEYEHRLLMPDRSVKHLHLITHGNRNADGQLEFIGAVQDVTQRRVAEEALGKVRSELTHAARVTSLGELTASIAHEVNQPLTAVLNNANACLSFLPDSIPDLQEIRSALAEIIEDADRASAIVGRVRQLVRKEPFAKALLNLRDVVADVSALARYESASQHVAIRTDLADDLPAVMADRVQLQQVLLNLVVNGMDAMKGTSPAKRILTVCGRREVRDGVPGCLLSVKDAGIGFKSDETEKLFEAFYTTKSHGMGMGLAISRSIIEAHGGRLWAEPNEGDGATFLFSLPGASNSTS